MATSTTKPKATTEQANEEIKDTQAVAPQLPNNTNTTTMVQEDTVLRDELARLAEKDAERVKLTAKYNVHFTVEEHNFPVVFIAKKQFGRDLIFASVKFHALWTKEFELEESDAVFIKIGGIERVLNGKMGKFNKRTKGKENEQYIGFGFMDGDYEINIPIDIEDYKNFTRIGYIVSKEK